MQARAAAASRNRRKAARRRRRRRRSRRRRNVRADVDARQAADRRRAHRTCDGDGERRRSREPEGNPGLHAKGSVYPQDHGSDGAERTVARNLGPASEPQHSRSPPRSGAQESPRMVARAGARLRRAAVSAARRRDGPAPARRSAAQGQTVQRRAAQLPSDSGSRVPDGEKTRVAALAAQEGVQTRRAERAAHAAPQHGVRRCDLRSALEVGEDRPAQSVRDLRRQRFGRQLRALHADVSCTASKK